MDEDPPDVTFIRKPGARGAVRCPRCAAAVPLPPTNPWLAMAGMEFAPTLAAFPCPECNEMIDVATAVKTEPPNGYASRGGADRGPLNHSFVAG